MNEETILKVNSLVRTKSRSELIKLCKEQNLCISGTKHDMAVRLIGGWNPDDMQLKSDIPKIIITRDDKGRWVFQNRLVFHDETKYVVGTVSGDEILPLKREDIELCKQYKFKYILPAVLDEDGALCRKQKDLDETDDEEEEMMEEED